MSGPRQSAPVAVQPNAATQKGGLLMTARQCLRRRVLRLALRGRVRWVYALPLLSHIGGAL